MPNSTLEFFAFLDGMFGFPPEYDDEVLIAANLRGRIFARGEE